MVNILSWNIRGLGSSIKKRALKEILYHNQIDIVGIQETKLESFSSRTLNALSNTVTHWTTKSSNGASGGLLLGINESKFWILNTWIMDFSITVHLKNKFENFEWLFTIVYGPVQYSLRNNFLSEIQSISILGPSAWLICGDFNLIRNRAEKQGPSYNFILSNRFNNLIANLNLIDYHLTDRKFTWARSISSPSKALLDRYLCTTDWFSHFSNSIVTSLPRAFSDHNPIILHTDSLTTTQNKIIKFEKTWLTQPGFTELIIKWWNSYILASDLGTSWKFKLQFLRRKLRGWHNNLQGEKNRQKNELLHQLELFETLQESNSLTPQDYSQWKECQTTLYKLFQEEETYWQQRAKLKWFLEGDQNTKFFHLTASIRKKKNTILSLEINDTPTYDPIVLRNHITSYFKDLLGTTKPRLLSLQPNLWTDSEKLTPIQQHSLESSFTMEELKTTVFSCNPTKAPGPDGISFLFYHTFWDLIKNDLMQILQSFYNRTLDISKLNLASIILIPKKTDAVTIKNYRPISLINCSFKIITKLLTNRLAKIIDPLIDDSQAAFIKGRLIGDNIICAHEVLHSVRLSKQKGILLKLDFEKAFDQVNWEFLFEILEARGFGSLFTNWIKDILEGGRSCVSFNGMQGSFFPCKKGLRQGDPLSPLLFDLVADALNKILSKAKDAGLISGLGNFSNSPKVLNLHFADDTILFLEANVAMIENLKFLLLGFESMSGLKINFEKSALVPLNITPELANDMALQLGCQLSSLPITYLGVPLHWKKLSTSEWQPLITKIENRLQTWKGSLLSLGGRVTLLNSVLSAIPIYWLSIYRLPVNIRSKIDRIRKKFLWAGSHPSSRKKYHLVAWDQVCLGKHQGGLGIINLERMNISLLAKWYFRFKDPTSSGKWKDILSDKYTHSGLSNVRCSHFWKGILSIKHIVELGITRIVNSGKDTLFWLDIWVGECALYSQYPDLFQLTTNPLLTVDEAFLHNNPSCSIHFNRQLTGTTLVEWHQLISHCFSPPIFTMSTEPDKILWRWHSSGLFTVHSLYLWLEYGGIKNTTYTTLWKTKIPLKIKIFIWLVKEGKILTKDNLAKKGWIGDQSCIFCGSLETIDHLFVTCPLISSLWSWIATHNNFTYNCLTLSDLWLFDAWIPLKDRFLIELIRAATLWVVWLARNKTCFNNTAIPSLATLGSQIISLTSFWCKSNLDESFFKLSLILPMDLNNLPQADVIILSETDTSMEESSSWDSEEDPCLGLVGSDLSEYLRDRADCDAADAAMLSFSDQNTSLSHTSSNDVS